MVKTLQKLFEGCGGGGGGDGDVSTTPNPMLAGRPRGKTRAELEAARREIEELRRGTTAPAATPSAPVGPSLVALEMATLSTNVVAAPGLATPPPRR